MINSSATTNSQTVNSNYKTKMKNAILLFLVIGLQIGCQSQKVPEDVDGFADQNFLIADKSNATYYRVHKRIEAVIGINVNPNANATNGQIMPDEYGSAFTATPSGVEHHEITFYDMNTKKELVAGALVKGEVYELYGLATWYDEDGNKTEAGFFKNSVRGNYYELYDKNGKVTDTGFYVKGEKFTDFKTDERLIGKWLCMYNSEGYFGQIYPMKLFNKFYQNGTIEIWNEADSEKSSIQGIEPNITRFHYSFETTGKNTGILTTIDYYNGQKDEERIEFIGEANLVSTITKHSDPSLVGTSFKFTKVTE